MGQSGFCFVKLSMFAAFTRMSYSSAILAPFNDFVKVGLENKNTLAIAEAIERGCEGDWNSVSVAITDAPVGVNR